MQTPRPSPDDIASCVLAKFQGLPAKCKPRIPQPGSGLEQREWVPLAGIVIEDYKANPPTISCVALATGMKCTPQAGLSSAQGNVLHDSHAEVLVMRAFNRLLLDQCLQLTTADKQVANSAGSLIVRNAVALDGRPLKPPFSIRDGLNIHMYCSECPCGDASMELVMSRQADPTPWTAAGSLADDLLGRGHFGHLGVVRRKPSRPDAPPTLSKSCSDKLALRQCISLLSALTALFVSPENAFLHGLVMHTEEIVPHAISRAFGTTGRLRGLLELNGAGAYPFRPFSVEPTTRSFGFRRSADDEHQAPPRPSDRACVHFGTTTEVIINGVVSGFKRTDSRAASVISRRRLWERAGRASEALGIPHLAEVVSQSTYDQVKTSPLLRFRRDIKHTVTKTSLSPWTSSQADRDWSL